VQELEQRLVHRAIHAADKQVTKPLFRSTLSKAFSDCFAIQPSLPTLPYSANSLTDVVRRYNAYMQPPGTARTVVKPRQTRIGGGIVGGATNAKMVFEGKSTLVSSSLATTLPVGGVFFVAAFPALNDNITLRLDVLYEQLNFEDSYVVAPGFSTVELREQASIRLKCLRLPLQLRYAFPVSRVRPFLFGGISGNYLLSSERKLRTEYTAGSGFVVTNTKAVPDEFIRSYEVGLLVGVGITAPGFKGHAIGVELRAERSVGFVYSSLYGAPIFRYSALMSFNLF
jgi:hypothetical protein